MYRLRGLTGATSSSPSSSPKESGTAIVGNFPFPPAAAAAAAKVTLTSESISVIEHTSMETSNITVNSTSVTAAMRNESKMTHEDDESSESQEESSSGSESEEGEGESPVSLSKAKMMTTISCATKTVDRLKGSIMSPSSVMISQPHDTITRSCPESPKDRDEDEGLEREVDEEDEEEEQDSKENVFPVLTQLSSQGFNGRGQQQQETNLRSRTSFSRSYPSIKCDIVEYL